MKKKITPGLLAGFKISSAHSFALVQRDFLRIVWLRVDTTSLSIFLFFFFKWLTNNPAFGFGLQ